MTKLQNVILISSDFAGAERFYAEGLGLSIKFRDGSKWMQMKAGSANVAFASPSEGPKTASGATPVFEVEDIDACLSRLVSMGATVVERRDMATHGRTASARDPDGNLLQIFQRSPVQDV